MCLTRAGLCLLVTSISIPAANLVGFTCGANNGTAIDNLNGTWTLTIFCADGVGFTGTATQVNTGAPSDYRIQGSFVDSFGGAFTDTINFPAMPGFTLPQGPMVAYWHELHGVMNLGGNQGANPLAQIAFMGAGPIDLQGAGGNCTTDDPGISTGFINGAFNIVGPMAFCNDTPLWTRGPVPITVSFNGGVAQGGSITLNAGSADSDFEGVPEPATWALVILGVLSLRVASGRRPRS